MRRRPYQNKKPKKLTASENTVNPKAKILQNDQHAIRACILFEYLQNKPVEVAYKSFCEILGEGFIEYRAFDFWFYRFWNGHLDLTENICFDTKSTSLSDMPPDILDEITSKLERFHRLSARKVCQKLRNSIDNQDYGIKTVGFNVTNDRANLELDSYHAKYIPMSGKSCQVYFGSLSANYLLKHFKKMSSSQLILIDVTTLINNPNVKLQKFKVNITSTGKARKQHFEQLENALRLMKCHVAGAEFSNCSTSEAAQLLSCFKAGSLEQLQFNKIQAISDEIFELEQWKRAKSLTLRGNGSLGLLPANQLLHFHMFDVLLNSFSSNDALVIRNITERSEKFEFVSIGAENFNVRNALKLFKDFHNGFLFSVPQISSLDYPTRKPYLTIEKANVQRTVFKLEEDWFYHERLTSFTPILPIHKTPYRERRHEILKGHRYRVDPLIRAYRNRDEKMIKPSKEVEADKYALRACILYDYLDKEPVIEAYAIFCETIDENCMSFREFDFWHQQFPQGTFDLKSNEWFDSKSLSLLKLPQGILNTILSKAEPIYRFNIWKLSGLFQPDILTGVQKLKILISKYGVSLDMDNHRVNFFEDACRNDSDVKIEMGRFDTWDIRYQSLATTLNDLKLMLENSKLLFKSFELKIDELYFFGDEKEFPIRGKIIENRHKTIKNAFDTFICIPANTIDGTKFEGVIPIVSK